VPAFLTTPAGRFRAIAIAEAISWTGLLVGMFVKYVVIKNPAGVEIFGPIHGAIFAVYLVMTIAVWLAFRWSTRTGVVGLLAGIPPFGTLIFERWATRTGRLSDADASAAPNPA
jgi:integral membrane protein